jgi:hypothetical protein
MTISGVGSRTSYIGSGITSLRDQLDTLTQQLSSGKISNTYAGQGSGRSLAIALRAQISNVAAYADTAVNLNTRIGVANLSLQRCRQQFRQYRSDAGAEDGFARLLRFRRYAECAVG